MLYTVFERIKTFLPKWFFPCVVSIPFINVVLSYSRSDTLRQIPISWLGHHLKLESIPYGEILRAMGSMTGMSRICNCVFKSLITNLRYLSLQ